MFPMFTCCKIIGMISVDGATCRRGGYIFFLHVGLMA